VSTWSAGHERVYSKRTKYFNQKLPKNLGFGKDTVPTQHLHGSNTRNTARAVLFSFSQVPPPSTINVLSRCCHAPLRGLSYLYICDTSPNLNLNDYDIYNNFTTFGNLQPWDLNTMSMVLVHVGNVGGSYKSSSPRVATSLAIITFMYLFVVTKK